MAGKRLLDAALLLAATRPIAKQHFRIRREQLEKWGQTSSLANSIKHQTDRVTVTFAAAAALARRLNEDIPPQHYNYSSQSSNDEPVPRKDSIPANTDGKVKAGLQQDHHYERSDQHASREPVPQSEMEVRQEQVTRAPLQHVTTRASAGLPESNVDIVNSSNPHHNSEAPAPATTATDTSNREATKTPFGDAIPSHDTVPEQQSPDGINTDIFHSPKVAQLLTGKGKPTRREYEMRLREAKAATTPETPNSLGHDSDTFNVRQGGSDFAAETFQESRSSAQTTLPLDNEADIHELASVISNETVVPTSEAVTANAQPKPAYRMRESRVPSSRVGRIWQYASLGSSMAFGALGETFRRAAGNGSDGSLVLSPANMERLVAKLSRMRGAALKLGQMMSFQDSKMLPKPIHDVLQRVQDNADYMPPSQRNQVLTANLGPNWKDLFLSFEDIPVAAASIGQVHKAVLASTNVPVAVKIQYPGVATSISSDLSNLSLLLTASRLLPRGLYLDKTIMNARTELAWECDYQREAAYQTRFRELLTDEDSIFTVPHVIQEASGPQVLTAEWMSGIGVTKESLKLSQEQRDWIGTQILRLCMRELTEFKLMQTDPNWTNFLYNPVSNKLELLDFGAAREFPPKFIDPYIGILIAASKNDRDSIRTLSIELGYLTGAETSTMLDAHVDSVLTLAEPFQSTRDRSDIYDFRDQTITERVRSFIPVMIKERLAPPPEETYSLHRKLSGAFLLLARLGSRVKCRELFLEAIAKWQANKTAP